jgi:hypothetical protein
MVGTAVVALSSRKITEHTGRENNISIPLTTGRIREISLFTALGSKQ